MRNCETCPAPIIELDINHLMSDMLGEKHGLNRSQIDKHSDAAVKAFENIQANRGSGWLGWMQLHINQDDVVEDILLTADSIRKDFKTFVLLGIGGSALGPIAVHQALNHLHFNELSDEKRKSPRFYVEDNVDPERMQALLDVIDLRTTCFNIITKSGATAETMSQYLIVSEALKKEIGKGWQKHIIATTDKEKGNLIKLAKKEGFKTFYIPSTVGGRFSQLSPVGLLAAAVCGIDIRSMLGGASCMDQTCCSSDIWKNPALLEAVVQFVLMQEMGINIHVMMPYADSLKYMADWFSQLWAESLGKNITRKGVPINVGQTPVKALGVTDQHSQLQLYTEGPFDKVITFLKVEKFRSKTVIPHGCEEFEDVAFLGGKSHNELIEAERIGTEYALLRAGRMSQTITLPVVNAHTIGQLIYFFELVTAYTGELLDIDAFNQPGVEESKIASYAVLGNTAEKYQKKQDEMTDSPSAKEQYIL